MVARVKCHKKKKKIRWELKNVSGSKEVTGDWIQRRERSEGEVGHTWTFTCLLFFPKRWSLIQTFSLGGMAENQFTQTQRDGSAGLIT